MSYHNRGEGKGTRMETKSIFERLFIRKSGSKGRVIVGVSTLLLVFKEQ